MGCGRLKISRELFIERLDLPKDMQILSANVNSDFPDMLDFIIESIEIPSKNRADLKEGERYPALNLIFEVVYESIPKNTTRKWSVQE